MKYNISNNNNNTNRNSESYAADNSHLLIVLVLGKLNDCYKEYMEQ